MPRSRTTADATPRGESVVRAGDAGGFLETLGKSDLLPETRVAELTERLGGWSPEAAASELVREGLLTRYQADRLRAGRYRGFFLDRYRLLAVLGAGGMGNVYVARDEGDGPTGGQRVALKVLAEGLRDDAGMIARLKYEGVAAGRVNHPNVVRALRFCKADNGPGDHLLVMEFVEAVSAEELLIRGGPVKSAAACDIARQAALGLAACHEANLIHRDVKPANLLVAADGTVKVADFGLALLTDQAAAEFSLQMIFGHDCVGSADYMAPEQSRNSTEIDPRADLYSLGCTLYSLLTARVPYPARTGREVLKAHRRNAVPDVRRKAPDTPAEVAALVARLMAKDPADRPANAAEVAALLEPHCRRKPVAFDFDTILNSRARAAAKKAERRRKEAALKAEQKRKANAPDAVPAAPSPAESDRETGTTADLDTARPDAGRRYDSSSILTAASLGQRRSAADLASEILGGGYAGQESNVRDSFSHLSHVGRRLESDAGAGTDAVPDSAVVDDWSPKAAPQRAEPAPSGVELPAISPPTRLVPAGLAGWFLPQIPVRGGRLTVGRSADCDVRLTDAGVAPEHCELRWNGRSWNVADLGGGTAVNDAPLHGGAGAELGHGDELTLGSRRFTLRLGPVRKPLGPWLVAAATALAAAGTAAAVWVF
ncbi:protein kinase [Alienimonas sp. DA493]|uniref:protein kinase domain-containing protein n=1 Tax=Alienimonas sp. DA493 TaxID=3373605 RepID=UPI0037544BA7